MKTLVLSAACMLISIFGNAMSPATTTEATSELTASPFTAAHITAMPANEKKTAGAIVQNKLTLNLNRAGTTFITGKCEKMTYYVPATGCRIAPSLFSFQLRTRTEHVQWAWKISTPILSGTLPAAVFSVQLIF